MGNSNSNKQFVCERYSEYLYIIYHFGNKVILIKQLYRYAQEFGLANSYSAFYGHIKQLINAEIIRKEAFLAYGRKTQLHMLTLKKFGIRFVEGKVSSQYVAAVPKANSNERILVSIFKNCYILNKIIPRICKRGRNVTFEQVIALVNQDNSNILNARNQGIELLYKIQDSSAALHPFLNINEINYEINKLKEIMQKRSMGLRKGSMASEGKGVGKVYSTPERALAEFVGGKEIKIEMDSQMYASLKSRKLDCYSIDSMLNAHMYVAQVKIIQGRPLITLLMFDIHNKQNVYSMATKIACAYRMFDRYFNDFSLKIGIVGVDEVACRVLESDSKAIVRNFYTKEIKGSKLSQILTDWQVNYVGQERIHFHFTHYDITNQYLDGVKYANLLRK
ncbi:hypothetical protein [Paenibacillus amylolyticus]|uniref:hypothetical protein n=1 Tax=Paenibacillus amylolyticus TaxID=1451 RepID=UPI00249AB01D|nr:hypothetical protein [Paenibacillus amylolyticus]WFA83410.1 hypothetical protein OGI70_20590 [Paenibacillus amylolyticus]